LNSSQTTPSQPSHQIWQHIYWVLPSWEKPLYTARWSGDLAGAMKWAD
jgi:hypothetical protein